MQAVIWQAAETQQPQIVSRSKYFGWDGKDLDALIKTADQALSECTTNLPQELAEPNDVLLGLPGDWVFEGQLLPDYRQVLKQLTSNLDLKAMGFVVTSEAIVHYLNSGGNGAVNGVLMGIEDEVLEVSLVVQGHVQQLLTYSHNQNVVAGILESLQQLEAGHLPPKIILFDGEADLTHLQQTLLQQDWEKAPVGFLHLPEVVYIPEHIPTEAIVFTATKPTLNVQMPPAEITSQAEKDDEIPSPDMVSAVEDVAVITPPTAVNQLAQVGFVKGKDIRQMPALNWEEVLNTDDDEVEAEAVNDDEAPISEHEEEISETEEELPLPVAPIEEVAPPRVAKIASEPAEKHQPVIKAPSRHWRFPWKIAMILVLLLGLLGGAGAYAMSTVKAELTLYVEPQLLEKALEVTVDPTAEQSNLETQVLRGSLMTTRTTGTTNVTTTGKTLVGEKAKGEVIIFNDTDSTRTLQAGTLLTSQGKQLKFTLDKEVSIASKSVDLSSATPFKAGQAKVAVTASQIGPEYNLEAQTAFAVANFSSSVLLARNDAVFAGGSSREIQAVAQADLTKLSEQLKSNLESQAKNQLTQQLNSAQKLIDSSLASEWVSRKFSHKVGDEANSVSLEGELKLEGVAYSESDFHALAKQALQADVKGDKKMTEQISTQFKLVEDQSAETYKFEVITKTYLLPVLEEQKIIDRVAGHRPVDVEGYLTNMPAVKEISLAFTPRMPEVVKRYPFKKENITVKIIPKT